MKSIVELVFNVSIVRWSSTRLSRGLCANAGITISPFAVKRPLSYFSILFVILCLSGIDAYAADTAKPSAPKNVWAVALSPTKIMIGWEKATDNVGVWKYVIFRDGEWAGIAVGQENTSYIDEFVVSGVLYEFNVIAKDAAKNESNKSETIRLKIAGPKKIAFTTQQEMTTDIPQGTVSTTLPVIACPAATPLGATMVGKIIDGTKLMAVVDFENGYLGTKDKFLPGGKKEIVNTSRAGSKAVRITVNENPAQCRTKYRAEMKTVPGQVYKWDDGKSHWVGISYNPVDFKGKAHTLFQIHAPNEKKGDPCDYAGNTITLQPLEKAGKMYYSLAAIENGGRSAGKGAFSNSSRVWQRPMKEGVWADFVFNFSLSTKGKGFFKVWKDGQKIYDKKGLTNVNHIDSCGKPIPANKRQHNGVHFGIYGPRCGYDGKRRVLLVDELRTAIGPNGYKLVAPSGSIKSCK